jgi:molybdenum cofactor cytidylyltransferase
MTSTKRIGAIILAAGGSVRMGSPKQLLKFEGTTLLRRVARSAIDADCDPVIVVTGSASKNVGEEFDGLDVHEIFNAQWPTGMASSIKVGIDEITRTDPDVDAVVMLVCDQPHVTAELLRLLITAYRSTTKKTIVASKYGEDFGVPALFDKKHFAELAELEGDRGAKAIIKKHARDAEFVDFPEGIIDVDTPADFKRLTSGDPG